MSDSTEVQVSAKAELGRKRWEHTQAMLAEPGHDLSTMTDDQFEGGLARVVKVQERLMKLIGTALKPTIHYGNPNNAFQRKILYKSGAQELRRVMSLQLRMLSKEVSADEEMVSVIVEVAAVDKMGRVAARSFGACNSKEKRFRQRKGDGWVYRDPRETIHDCLMMAEKRAGVAATLEASGATGFFATEDALTDLEEGAAELAEQMAGRRAEWSPEQRTAIYAAASRVGMTRGVFKQFLDKYLGEVRAPFADECEALYDEVNRWKPAPKVETTVVEQEKAPLDRVPPALDDTDQERLPWE